MIRMTTLQGVYDGQHTIQLSSNLPLPPNTKVEILVRALTTKEKKERMLQLLLERGVIQRIAPGHRESNYEPIAFEGKPISETVIEERR